MHHYFRSQVPFVKGPWVRTVGFQDFTYFMRKAAEMYGNIPSGKGEDDGSVFNTFLKESRYSKDMREVQWEDIREILEKYKVSRACVYTAINGSVRSESTCPVYPILSERPSHGSVPSRAVCRTTATSIRCCERV